MLKLIIASLLFTSSVYAEEFQAPVTDTNWHVIESPLECSLMQTIPSFGQAGFYRRNGQSLQLKFVTDSLPAQKKDVHFEMSAAPWQNTDQFDTLVTLPTTSGQREFIVDGVLAQQALSKMQDGRFPIIRYHSQSYNGETTVKLSTVKFNDSLPAFQQCLSNLYPDSFDEIKKLTVYFESEKANLDKASINALTRVADYVKVDDCVSQIIITSHTDSFGRKRLNVPLSEARAKTIRDFFVSKYEIPAEKIVMRSFVDHDPAATNKTAKGRAYNRRAEIELVR
ncbi:flagellar protein MotY [Methylophaga sulfidovorans]|uniref:OmpA family protein n=1 Tax=Methylophaga sulfidovorans TaxID=45496 RepID=A0A1I3ZIX0_9GAMM|nr:OmpA family protein [Methylophaga sulfidovorans]SFK44003.1 OmpA family protein [Methylophaga sulfidovorans]